MPTVKTFITPTDLGSSLQIVGGKVEAVGAPPTGTAGGVLTGGFPNPTFSPAGNTAIAAIANTAANAAAANVTATGATGGILSGTYPNPSGFSAAGVTAINAAVTATPNATNTTIGVSRLATNAEALAGTSNAVTVTPLTATAIAQQVAAAAVSAGLGNAFPAASQAAMLAANAKDNDICIRTDLGGQWFVCAALPSTNIANWYAVPSTPALAVSDEGTALTAAATSFNSTRPLACVPRSRRNARASGP